MYTNQLKFFISFKKNYQILNFQKNQYIKSYCAQKQKNNILNINMIKPFIKQKNSTKWMQYSDQQVYDMGIADMGVGFYQPIYEQIITRMKALNNFTYKSADSEYFTAIIQWYKHQHNQTITKEMIIPIPSINQLYISSLLAFTTPKDPICLMTPVFSTYHSLAQLHNRAIIPTEMNILNGRYMINWADLQAKLAKAKMFVLCSPHNPTGRVWKKAELDRIVKLCSRYGVYLYADEILCDLCAGQSFCSVLSYNYEKIIVGNSLSKAFNCSSLGAGYTIIKAPTPNQQLRSITENKLRMYPTELALLCIKVMYSDLGRAWLTQIHTLIRQNYAFMQKWLKLFLPKVQVMELQSTYLAVLDFTHYVGTGRQLRKKLQAQKVYVTSMNSYYYPEKDTMQVRVCIAVELNFFIQMLMKLTNIFVTENSKL